MFRHKVAMTDGTQKEPFEIWAPKKIRALREEADMLERALTTYQSDNLIMENGELFAPTTARVQLRVAPSRQSTGGRPQKYGALIGVLESFADYGMAVKDMAAAAKEVGTPMEPNVLRSFIWIKKKRGEFVQVGDRIVSAKWVKQIPNESTESSENKSGESHEVK
jgi:hypothetical protein